MLLYLYLFLGCYCPFPSIELYIVSHSYTLTFFDYWLFCYIPAAGVSDISIAGCVAQAGTYHGLSGRKKNYLQPKIYERAKNPAQGQCPKLTVPGTTEHGSTTNTIPSTPTFTQTHCAIMTLPYLTLDHSYWFGRIYSVLKRRKRQISKKNALSSSLS